MHLRLAAGQPRHGDSMIAVSFAAAAADGVGGRDVSLGDYSG